MTFQHLMKDPAKPLPSVVPFSDLEASGYHWREHAVGAALHLTVEDTWLFMRDHEAELLQHGPLPPAEHLDIEDFGIVLDRALNARQLLVLLLQCDSDLSRALRSAALDGFRDLTPEALKTLLMAMGGTLPETAVGLPSA